jgi:hypothetical protein
MAQDEQTNTAQSEETNASQGEQVSAAQNEQTGMVNNLKAMFDIYGFHPQTSEHAKNMYEAGLRIVNSSEAQKEPATERARALAGLLRSYIPFGILEYLYWATRVVIVSIALFKLGWRLIDLLERFGKSKNDGA